MRHTKKNKGFERANTRRRGDKIAKLVSKRVKARRGEGPELTKSESEYLKRFGY
jgi:hypothetical protein